METLRGKGGEGEGGEVSYKHHAHHTAPHRIASHRIASHRIASHRIASHRIASHEHRKCSALLRCATEQSSPPFVATARHATHYGKDTTQRLHLPHVRRLEGSHVVGPVPTHESGEPRGVEREQHLLLL